MTRNDIAKVWLTKDAIWIELHNGQQGVERFTDYPRLLNADESQRANYSLSHFGIHWPKLDEDLSFDGFFYKS